MENKKRGKIFFMAVILIILGITVFLASMFFSPNKILDEKEVYMQLIVGNKTGFAVTNVSLDFGRLKAGTSSDKEVMLTNGYSFPVLVEFSFMGNISQYMIKNNPERLEVEGRKNVTISTIIISNDAVYGNYSGNLIITFKRAK